LIEVFGSVGGLGVVGVSGLQVAGSGIIGGSD